MCKLNIIVYRLCILGCGAKLTQLAVQTEKPGVAIKHRGNWSDAIRTIKAKKYLPIDTTHNSIILH